jgi:hypothetical protein
VEVVTGDLLVARLAPWSPDGLEKAADRQFREEQNDGVAQPMYSVSVFVTPVEPGRDLTETMIGLCGHIRQIPLNAKWVTFTTGRKLADQNFTLRLSEPPPKHYDVLIGPSLDAARVSSLSAVLSEYPRRRFPACDQPVT